MNILAYGETTLDGDMNITPYFEAMYNTYEVNQNSGEGQLFPEVPALNPYNLCNPNAENGVDCGLAYDAYLTNPNIVQNFANYYLDAANCFGVPAPFCSPATFGLLTGGYGAVPTLPIVSVRGDRNLVDVEMEQMRLVVGASMDLPFP
jgi:iron complex outermembrane receptor protein